MKVWNCLSFETQYVLTVKTAIIISVLSDLEAVVRKCSDDKVFLKMSRNSQENSCVSLFFNEVAGLRLWRGFFPLNFTKILRTFLKNTYWNTSSGCFCRYFTVCFSIPTERPDADSRCNCFRYKIMINAKAIDCCTQTKLNFDETLD